MAAVRRVRKPGCKFDETLVLENPEQGTNKSSALQILAVKSEWFSDNLSFNLRGREAIEQTTGVWIAEFPELRGLARSDRDKRKAFQSRTVDIGRAAYAHTVMRARRQYVPIATTNDESYLDDLTGNRRFWPMQVGRFDLETLKRDVDQLWAEAASREATGASIRLPEELWAAAAAEQQDRVVDNPFIEAIDRTLRDAMSKEPMQGKIEIEDLLTIVGLRVERRSPKQYELLNDAMKQLGWKKVKHLRVGEGRVKGRRPPHYVSGPQPYKRIVVQLIGHKDGTPPEPTAFYEGKAPPF
jgi:predicted P-loop ATPase